MAKTFTYNEDLSTALYYARWRLDDLDPQATVDETQSPSPYLWDQTYTALFTKYGVQGGMIQAARVIAAKLAKDISSFGEAAGIRVSWKDKDYYERLAVEISNEPPYDDGSFGDVLDCTEVVSGDLERGVTDADNFREFLNPPPAWPLGEGVE